MVYMKRSEINAIQQSSKAFLADHRFLLPPWAEFRPADWAGRGKEIVEIRGQYARVGRDRFRVRRLQEAGTLSFHPSERQPEAGQEALRRKDHDRRCHAGDADALPLPQNGRHHQPRRRETGHRGVRLHVGRKALRQAARNLRRRNQAQGRRGDEDRPRSGRERLPRTRRLPSFLGRRGAYPRGAK